MSEVTQLKTGQHIPKRTKELVQQEYTQAAVEVGNLHLSIETVRAQQHKATMRMAKLAEEFETFNQTNTLEEEAKATSENAEGISLTNNEVTNG